MNRRFLAALVLTPVVTLPLLPAAPAEAAPGERTWIVRYDQGVDPATKGRKVRAMGHRVDRTLQHVFPGSIVRMSEAEAKRLASDPQVAAVYENKPVRATVAQYQPGWALDRIDQATGKNTWFSSFHTGQGVPVYLFDSGLDRSLAEFGGRAQAGVNIVDSQPMYDDYGHGTHVAGLVGSNTYGAAKRATLVPVRVLDSLGDGDTEGVLNGIDWVLAHHKDHTRAVANMSLGSNGIDQAIDVAVRKMVAEGITVVASAGNTNQDACQVSPGHLPEVVTVGAVADTTTVTNPRWAPTSWQGSNWGPCVDLFAPGVRMTSTWPTSMGGRGVETGTSMAAPLVAGIAANILQARPAWTPAQVQSQLIATSWKGTSTSPRVGNRGSGSPDRLLRSMTSVTPGQIEKPVRPVVTGTARVGQVLKVTTGTWGIGTVKLARQWERINVKGVATPIAGATGSSYRLTSADRYFRIRVRVTASKPSYQTTSNFSAVTAQVR